MNRGRANCFEGPGIQGHLLLNITTQGLRVLQWGLRGTVRRDSTALIKGSTVKIERFCSEDRGLPREGFEGRKGMCELLRGSRYPGQSPLVKHDLKEDRMNRGWIEVEDECRMHRGWIGDLKEEKEREGSTIWRKERRWRKERSDVKEREERCEGKRGAIWRKERSDPCPSWRQISSIPQWSRSRDESPTMNLQRWISNDEYPTMNLQRWISNDEYPTMNIQRWISNDDSPTMNLQRWISNDEATLVWVHLGMYEPFQQSAHVPGCYYLNFVEPAQWFQDLHGAQMSKDGHG
jgi:hypothetical protein